jgi:hypothetical protein
MKHNYSSILFEIYGLNMKHVVYVYVKKIRHKIEPLL